MSTFFDPTSPITPVGLGYLGVTDEYLADLTASEFALICPRDQDGAAGDDGAFEAGDLFTLTSASTDFAAQGIQPGDICAVLSNKLDSSRVRGLFAVVSLGGHSVTLRTRGPRAGFGMPPGQAGGETGLRFRIPTGRPQIAMSAAKYGRRYRITNSASLKDPTDFVPVVAYDALVELYTLASRQASIVTTAGNIQAGGAKDSLYAKAKNFAADRDAEVAILDATYGIVPDEMPLVVGVLRLPSGVHRPFGTSSLRMPLTWTDSGEL